jgi:hypothetical protein
LHAARNLRKAYLNEVVDEDNGDEENGDLEAVEVESHVLRLAETDPADNDHEREDEEGDLQT